MADFSASGANPRDISNFVRATEVLIKDFLRSDTAFLCAETVDFVSTPWRPSVNLRPGQFTRIACDKIRITNGVATVPIYASRREDNKDDWFETVELRCFEPAQIYADTIKSLCSLDQVIGPMLLGRSSDVLRQECAYAAAQIIELLHVRNDQLDLVDTRDHIFANMRLFTAKLGCDRETSEAFGFRLLKGTLDA